MIVHPDKIRFLDQEQTDYSVTALEVSDGRSLENFITFWIRAGHEDDLLRKIENKLWKNLELRSRHVPPIFHRDDFDSTWSITAHHYHIPYDHIPNKKDVLDLIELINSVKGTKYKYISPELKHKVKYLKKWGK